MVDLTGDGKLDMLTGSYPGQLYLFRGLDGGEFAAREEVLGHDGEPLDAGYAASPYAVDWDRDGDLDLLVGDIEGEVKLYPRQGDAPRFGPARPLGVKVKGDAGPTAADWNGDGVLDLIVGAGDGAVVLLQGQDDGKGGAPALGAPVQLIGPVSRGGGNVAQDGHGIRAKPHAVDWNGDGRLDLLVGDYSNGADRRGHGFVWLYARAAVAPQK